jgi:hypothetical protein
MECGRHVSVLNADASAPRHGAVLRRCDPRGRAASRAKAEGDRSRGATAPIFVMDRAEPVPQNPQWAAKEGPSPFEERTALVKTESALEPWRLFGAGSPREGLVLPSLLRH